MKKTINSAWFRLGVRRGLEHSPRTAAAVARYREALPNAPEPIEERSIVAPNGSVFLFNARRMLALVTVPGRIYARVGGRRLDVEVTNEA
jgi:hypothetical protein